MLVRHSAETEKADGHMGLEYREPPATMKVIGHDGSVRSHSFHNFATMPGAKVI